MDLYGIERLWEREAMKPSNQLVGVMNSTMMSEFDALERISVYVGENRLKADLEAKVQHMTVKANEVEIFDVGQRINIELKPPGEPQSADMENGRRPEARLHL